VLTLIGPNGVSVKLHDREGSARDNIVQTFSVANRPALAQLAGGPIAGSWKLRVQDLADQDEGKLNRWALVMVPRSG
jgi:subtilisin-like proprotein convertase family protein